MVQYVRIRYRVQAVDTKFSVHSRARGRRHLIIGIIHTFESSIYYMLDTVKSAMEFISSSLQVLRDSAAVHVGTVRYPHSM
jgi:hypothetical protein